MTDAIIRDNLIELLKMGSAHVTLTQALSGLKQENRNIIAHQSCHTIWEELEHMRLAQEDILHYTLDPEWISPKWPKGYWPEKVDTLTDEQWSNTVNNFNSDMTKLIELVENSTIDLTTYIPHGKGHTYLRELMLVADHNAYHIGKIVQVRKFLKNW
jgi:hypothetical protein